MNCKFFKIRSKKYQRYYFCGKKKEEVTLEECKLCGEKEFKNYRRMSIKSKKLAKLENNRFSILQGDTSTCFLCGRKMKLDKHEAFGGANRQKSMKWGLIFYLCRKCHRRADLDLEIKNKLHAIAKEEFIKRYGSEKFLEEFKKNYLF